MTASRRKRPVTQHAKAPKHKAKRPRHAAHKAAKHTVHRRKK